MFKRLALLALTISFVMGCDEDDGNSGNNVNNGNNGTLATQSVGFNKSGERLKLYVFNADDGAQVVDASQPNVLFDTKLGRDCKMTNFEEYGCAVSYCVPIGANLEILNSVGENVFDWCSHSHDEDTYFTEIWDNINLTNIEKDDIRAIFETIKSLHGTNHPSYNINIYNKNIINTFLPSSEVIFFRFGDDYFLDNRCSNPSQEANAYVADEQCEITSDTIINSIDIISARPEYLYVDTRTCIDGNMSDNNQSFWGYSSVLRLSRYKPKNNQRITIYSNKSGECEPIGVYVELEEIETISDGPLYTDVPPYTTYENNVLKKALSERNRLCGNVCDYIMQEAANGDWVKTSRDFVW